MTDVIEETLDWDSEPTPIDYARCRAIVGAASQCKNAKKHEVQGKGMCEIHFMSLQRGRRLRFQKDKVE